MQDLKNGIIYDLPVRLFHWIFAGLFIFSFVIAKTVDDESFVYQYHMISGLIMGFIVLLRIAWGWTGTRYSLFKSFIFHPKELMNYFTDIFSRLSKSNVDRKWSGHNPASSWSALLMLTFALGLSFTGFFMTQGFKESFEDIHEFLAHSFLFIAISHVLGLILHMIRHRDGIVFSMINGTKRNVKSGDLIVNSKFGYALLFLTLTFLFSTYVIKNYDKRNGNLSFMGLTLKLGENEESPEKQDELENEEREEVDED